MGLTFPPESRAHSTPEDSDACRRARAEHGKQGVQGQREVLHPSLQTKGMNVVPRIAQNKASEAVD